MDARRHRGYLAGDAMSGPPPWWDSARNRAELSAVRDALFADGLLSHEAASQIESRLASLEELLVTRWPRRWLVRRRLARQLRRSATWRGWEGGIDFRYRRAQAVSGEYADPPGGTVAFPPMRGSRPPGRHRLPVNR